MHLYLAIFWFIVGVIVQIFWTDLSRMAVIPVDRYVMLAIFMVLFSYNMLRWRLERALRVPRAEVSAPPPKPRVVEYDPALDFSKPQTDEPRPSGSGPPPAP